MIEDRVDIIEQVLAQVPRPDGFVGAHLLDAATGDVLAGVAVDPGEALPVLAAAVVRALQEAGDALAGRAIDEDLQELILTTTGHHHVARLLPELGGTGAVLLVTLDRHRANLAQARYLLRRLEVPLVP